MRHFCHHSNIKVNHSIDFFPFQTDELLLIPESCIIDENINRDIFLIQCFFQGSNSPFLEEIQRNDLNVCTVMLLQLICQIS